MAKSDFRNNSDKGVTYLSTNYRPLVLLKNGPCSMTEANITELFERLARLMAATKQHAGNGTAWNCILPNGETHRYIIRGVRSHADAEDSAFNLFIWIWNARDYLKQRAEVNGKNPSIIEN